MKRRVLLAVHPKCRPDQPPPKNGPSGETERHVWRALQELGHEVEVAGVESDLRGLDKHLARFRPAIVFNLLEEFRGEAVYDFHVVSYLESLGVPYTGCNPRGLVISRNKLWMTLLAQGFGVDAPRSASLDDRKATAKLARAGVPMFVKYNREDASFGLTRKNLVRSKAELATVAKRLHGLFPGELIVQEFVKGLEVSVGVWGNQKPEALPPWQLRLRGPGDFATEKIKFDAAYRRRRGIRAGRFRGPETREIQLRAAELFKALDLSGYARFDFRITPEGRPYLLDVNPNPNLSRTEDFASSAKFAGKTYLETVQAIIDLGLRYSPRI